MLFRLGPCLAPGTFLKTLPFPARSDLGIPGPSRNPYPFRLVLLSFEGGAGTCRLVVRRRRRGCCRAGYKMPAQQHPAAFSGSWSHLAPLLSAPLCLHTYPPENPGVFGLFLLVPRGPSRRTMYFRLGPDLASRTFPESLSFSARSRSCPRDLPENITFSGSVPPCGPGTLP